MLKYYLISSVRNLKRNLRFSVINITGLSLTMVLIIMLFSWLSFEFSFDRFHDNGRRIYRLYQVITSGESIDRFAGTPAPLGDAIKNEFPEISEYVRFGSMGRQLINEQFWENIVLSDPSIFKIFSFKLISGDPESALTSPGSIILDETSALKYFGKTDVTGQTIFVGVDKRPFTITGVLEDVPMNSQLRFRFLASFGEITKNLEWGSWNYSTYIMAENNNAVQTIREKLPAFTKTLPRSENRQLFIQPLFKIHLHSNLRGDLPTNSDIKTIYIAVSVLLLVLIVACINYMNLATARFTVRGKEAGIRKVSGATNADLRRLFMSESTIMTFVSFLVALALCYFLIPVFRSLVDMPTDILIYIRPVTVLIFILLITFISLISGSYPSLILSTVNPVAAIRSEFNPGRSMTLRNLRRILVIFQFFVSIILIACTMIIRSQMVYVENRDIGLIPAQVVAIPIYQSAGSTKYDLFKTEILKNPDILNASAVCYFPGKSGYYQDVWWEGLDRNDKSKMIGWIPADHDFVSTLKIELVMGESPVENHDKGTRCYILNESAVKMTGWEDPLGKKIDIAGEGIVTGVVKDFNFKSLHKEIEPVALTPYPSLYDHMLIKISTGKFYETINFLRAEWKKFFHETVFEYSFLDEDFQKMYEKDTTIMKMITVVSVLSLFISCIGLFGLVIFTTDSRTKEIGIRKVSGSTSREILAMLSAEFILWIFIALAAATPLIITLMHKWLEGFAYRIRLGWWFFVLTGVLTIVFSLFTVGWHTWHIARKNPVDCIRHE
jgi:putative ABC transport system permease protein